MQESPPHIFDKMAAIISRLSLIEMTFTHTNRFWCKVTFSLNYFFFLIVYDSWRTEIFLNKGQNRPLLVYFRHFLDTMTNVDYKMEKLRWCVFDSNQGPENGRRTRIHWATYGAPTTQKCFPIKQECDVIDLNCVPIQSEVSPIPTTCTYTYHSVLYLPLAPILTTRTYTY